MSGWSKKKKLSELSGSVRTGVLFLVGWLRKGTFKYWITIGAPLFVATITENLAVEILELAWNALRDKKV